MTDTTTTGAILVQDTLGRVRTPREKREQILDEYERSGMSGAAFAALAGVKYPTLASWIQQRRRNGAAASLATAATVRWVEAVPAHAGLIEESHAPLAALWVFDLPSQNADYNITADNARSYQLR
jgi:transposase-like protein